MSRLEKKWWFVATISVLSTFLTIALTKSAGIWPANGFAQGLIYLICFIGCWRCLSFLMWLVLFFASPKNTLLD